VSKLFRVTITDIDDNVRWGHTAKYSEEFLEQSGKSDPQLALEALDFLRKDLIKQYGLKDESVKRGELKGRAYAPDEVLDQVEVKNSSNIREVRYTAAGNMVVQFKNGTEYLYKNVERSVYDEMTMTESAGKFLNSVIKGKYEYEKLEDDGEKAETNAADQD
jgi:hypothetical protein